MIQIEVINEEGRSKKFRDSGPLGNAKGRAFQIYTRSASEGKRVTVKVLHNGSIVGLYNKAKMDRMARR